MPRKQALVAAAAAVVAAGAVGTAGMSAPAAAAPAIQAPAAIVVEASTGDVLFARHARQRRAIASTTKLMTALLTLERDRLSRSFAAPPYHPLAAESVIGLRAGERMRVHDLLRALLLPSANDAAYTLAQGTAGSVGHFVTLMNARARRLGLRRTHYSTPIGLDSSQNYSTAGDLAAIALYLRAHFPYFRQTVRLGSARLRSSVRFRTVLNRNDLVRHYSFVNGIKTGHTLDAGYVLVGSAARHGVSVVSVVLGDPSEAARDADTLALLRYGLRSYRVARAVRRGAVLARPTISHRSGKRVALVAARSYSRVVRRNRRVRVYLHAPSSVDGPLHKGTAVGLAVVRLGSRTLARIPLVTARAVPAAPLGTRLFGWLDGPGRLGLLLVLVAAAAYAVRRWVKRRRDRGEIETGTA